MFNLLDIHRKGDIGREITVLKYNIIYYTVYRCIIILVDKLTREIFFLLAYLDEIMGKPGPYRMKQHPH